MIRPIINQPKNRSQVFSGSDSISTKQQATERPGIHGTNGTRNPRGRSGCFAGDNHARGYNGESEQRPDVRQVGKRADIPDAGRDPDDKSRHPGADVGCLVLRVRRARTPDGSNRSRDIANHTRACPYWKTSSDESIPTARRN